MSIRHAKAMRPTKQQIIAISHFFSPEMEIILPIPEGLRDCRRFVSY
jgi:hypothetical protein